MLGVTSWLIASGRSGFFSTGARDVARSAEAYAGTGGALDASALHASELDARNVTHVRTRLTLPLARWEAIKESRGIELLDLLNAHAAGSTHVAVSHDVAHWSREVKAAQVSRWIMHEVCNDGLNIMSNASPGSLSVLRLRLHLCHRCRRYRHRCSAV